MDMFSECIVSRGKLEINMSCRILYSFVVYLYMYVSRSGSITSVGEERANLSAVVYL